MTTRSETSDTATASKSQANGGNGDSQKVGHFDWPQIWLTVRKMWSQYTWAARSLMILLVAACVYGMVAAGSPDNWCVNIFSEQCLWGAKYWLNAFASDAFRTLLALCLALAVAIRLKIQADTGGLDGAQHYGIARALAFGYYRNFLSKALPFVARAGAKLYVVEPDSAAAMKRFNDTVLQPKVLSHAIAEIAIESPDKDGYARKIFTVSSVAGADPLYFDLPTTLYTIHDYYKCWNEWARDENRLALVIEDDDLPANERLQIGSFFNQLKLLGSGATSLMQDMTGAQLEALELLNSRMVRISSADLQNLLERRP